MDLSDLKPSEGSKKNKKRVGRGHGTGQGAQAGRCLQQEESRHQQHDQATQAIRGVPQPAHQNACPILT